jgi:hypothetical protein
MQPNAKQIVVIILAMIGFTATGVQQLEPVIGLAAVKAVASICTFIGGLMAAALAPFLSNANVVLDAKKQTGVEVVVDRTAAPAIAAMAIDPNQDGISPAPGESAALKRVAEGASI